MCSQPRLNLGLLAALALLVATVWASPAAVSANSFEIDVRATAETNFASSCTDIAYFGYCRIEANCTADGSAATKGKELQHTFLDLGQCIGYDSGSKSLKWLAKSITHWQSTYCAPCSQCTIDAKTTIMTCQCQYTDATDNHPTRLTLSNHVVNKAGVLGCLNAVGDPDRHP